MAHRAFSEEFGDVFALADDGATSFWAHSNQEKDRLVGIVEEWLRVGGKENPSSAIHELISAFDRLYGLREALLHIEAECREKHKEEPGATIYWEDPALRDAFGSCVHALATVVDMISGIKTNKTPRLKMSWDRLTAALDKAFNEILPPVYTVVYEYWDKHVALSGLPDKAIGLKNLAKEDRAFIPRTLLKRFISVSLQNLKTGAFSGWTADQIQKSARAEIQVFRGTDSMDHETVCIEVSDNGPLFSHQSTPGHGTGLSGIRAMARYFEAQLEGPTTNADRTTVRFTMRYRGGRYDIDTKLG